MQNEKIDTEMLEIEATLKNHIFKSTPNECELSDVDLLNMETENCNKLSLSRSSSVLDKIIFKMASHSWPKTIPKLVTTHFSDVKKQFDSNNLKNSRPNMNRNKRTFEEQIIAINQSRSPSGARYLRKFPDSNRFRSKSQGNYVRIGNLAIKNNPLSKTSSNSSNNIKIINILGKEIIRLPCYLEREIRIKKNFYPLGIVSVDCCVDEGINGCIIKKIESNSACAKDGRLKVGDHLLSVNNEQMRILSNSSARAILNRASLTSKDVVVIYIPHESAFKFKKNVIKFEKAQSDIALLTTLSSSPIKSFRAASVSTSSISLSTSSSLSNSSVSKSSYSTKSVSLESLCSFSNQYDGSAAMISAFLFSVISFKLNQLTNHRHFSGICCLLKNSLKDHCWGRSTNGPTEYLRRLTPQDTNERLEINSEIICESEHQLKRCPTTLLLWEHI
ncbi:multiple pdz domain [Brachionus plicatilis]|uniref:Multiple pdz domain n=1 Tax=Brachionus plicatilis TaxID=10195 RepID=A0A3M7S160_BRAPC|nr:multiple pdz domain [Brachionus plicatilis]